MTNDLRKKIDYSIALLRKAEDFSPGLDLTICGVSDASTVLARNLSRRLITTVTRAVVSMRE
nr:MAG TPA: hypothetical protein [Caudoviricetes sp.]